LSSKFDSAFKISEIKVFLETDRQTVSEIYKPLYLSIAGRTMLISLYLIDAS